MVVNLTPPPTFNPVIGVAACYVESESKILLLLRQDHKPQGNTWCLPGGKLDAGDSPLEAVIREVREETSINLKANNLLFFKSLYVQYSDMDFIYHLFHSRLIAQPKVIISLKEHKRYQWVTPIDALKLSLTPDEDVCMKIFYGIKE